MKTVEFFYDFGSPASYLAYTQIEKLAERCGATLVWKPFLLGGVFKAVGNQSPAMIPAKGAWLFGDLALWAKRYGVKLAMNPHFPVNTLYLMRGATWALAKGRHKAFADAAFRAMWAEAKNMGDPKVIGEVLAAAGFDPAEVMAGMNDETVKDALKAVTEEAVARGAFGAPTTFVGKEMFWGQDRLDFVEEALKHG